MAGEDKEQTATGDGILTFIATDTFSHLAFSRCAAFLFAKLPVGGGSAVYEYAGVI